MYYQLCIVCITTIFAVILNKIKDLLLTYLYKLTLYTDGGMNQVQFRCLLNYIVIDNPVLQPMKIHRLT